jgi:hypothetical protein
MQQDNRLLQYYKKLAVSRSKSLVGRHAHVVHAVLLDTPLSDDPTETLSKDLNLSEVFPPQYAVTRELL